MTHARPTGPRRARLLALAALTSMLLGCGGGGGSAGSSGFGGPGCSVADQQGWLAGYMNDWYFWYALSPRPAAAGYADVASYFAALLYTGTDARFPSDRWSYYESTETFNRFFGDGATLGYGVSVAGLEVAGSPQQPLYVRYVEPASPAAKQGVARGDRVLTINGRSAAEVITANDFSALSPAQAGEVLTLGLARGTTQRTVTLTAAVFTLTPVTGTSTFISLGGRRIGYVAVKDMISQALAPLDAAFAQFKAAGVADVVLDLRYNGGGLVSTGATLASYIAGARGNGLAYASLLYNDKRAAANNQSYPFTNPPAGLGLARVFVLTGRRTCSASEQVINGLRGAGITVIAIGETTCGKPVGFLPSSNCGQTYSIVNFESVNQRNEGRYFDGFAATCAVAEDFTAVQASTADPLFTAATAFADGGACPAAAAQGPQALSVRRSLPAALEPGERRGMIDR